jgi:glycosyltransferase involved in cell wall biosynthesis
VVTCDFPGAKDYEEVDGVHVHRFDSYKFPTSDFGSWVFMMNVNMQKYAAELIKSLKNEVDIIHAHDWLVANAGIGLKHIFRIPLIATIHSTEYGRRNGLHTDYQRMIHQTEFWLAHEAWKTICCSKYMASHVSWAFSLPKENIEVFPNGVDIHEFSEPYDRDIFRKNFAGSDEKLVLYVGRLVHEKGVNLLVDAVPKVLSKVNAKFVIVGNGYMKDALNRQAWNYGVANKVFITGFLEDRTVKLLFRSADVLAAPSLYEPFGIVALEAMAARTPVVVSDVGGLSEIVEHDKTGVKVYPNDPNSLAWGLVRVLTDKRYAEWLTENAFQRVLGEYNWDKIADKTRNLYRKVLDEYQKGLWKPTVA